MKERIKNGDHVMYDLVGDQLMFRRMTPDEVAAFTAKQAGVDAPAAPEAEKPAAEAQA